MRLRMRTVTSAVAISLSAVGAGGMASAEPTDPPLTWFVTCDLNESGRTEPIMGGRLFIDAFDGRVYRSELVGPVANSYESAVAAARAFAPVYGSDCEPTPHDEIWMIGVPYCDPARAAAGRALPGC